jgi:hypothetical protein
MAITNPFSIQYGTRAIGGGSHEYLLHGPYVLDKSFSNIRVVFDVIVVASSFATLQQLSDTLEADFRKRDQSLVIRLDATTWTYTFGSTILNTVSSIVKSGNPDTDRGYGRAYTVTIEGELPADDAATGLRDIEFHVDYEPSRRRIATMRGVYTSNAAAAATANYQDAAGADAEAATFLTALDNAATFELVQESYTEDRTGHVCNFTRQYAELLANQSQGALDDPAIRDHRVVFTDLSQHPGDGAENIYRLRRVAGSYECSVDIDVTTDLQGTFANIVRPHVIELFRSNFTPKVMAVEDHRISYDETSKRMSVSIQLLYQKAEGDDIVEVSQSVAYREAANIDYTPIHRANAFAAEADVGWAIRERLASRTVMVIGGAPPSRRIGGSVNKSGWNIVQNTSQSTPMWVGDPDAGEQIQYSILTETVVERFHSESGGSGGGGGGGGKVNDPWENWRKYE